MNGKATGVFWIGLILIFLNFWLSGQSTTFWKAISKPGSSGSVKDTSRAILGVGLELAILGVATGIAAASDETGTIMITFMGGLMLLFLIHHTAFTKAIPNLLAMANTGKTATS